MKRIARLFYATILSLIVWAGLSFLFLLLTITIPAYPPQGSWVFWVSGGITLPVAAYVWILISRKDRHPFSPEAQAKTLVGIGVA